MDKRIDVTFDFTTDTPNYWENLYAGKSGFDPDIWSPKMREYHQLLYSRVLPNGELFDLKIGGNGKPDSYLYWKDFRFGSDSIINMYTHCDFMQNILSEIKKQKCDFKEFREKYLRTSYTIGGEIIFPKNGTGYKSMNSARGLSKKISDRFDLTLECIRRFYNNEDSPLTYTIEYNKNFFELFIDFKGYVDFFYLNDLVSDDYKSVKFFLDFDNFKENPRPQTVEEWKTLYDKQMEFLSGRNDRINRMFNK